jgi:hypothetical protein
MSAGIFKEAFFGVLQMTIQSWFRKYIPQTYKAEKLSEAA